MKPHFFKTVLFNHTNFKLGKILAVRQKASYFTSVDKPFIKQNLDLKPEYDVVIIGAGHNGLVSAAYLQKSGVSVCVLERRHVVGGAAVTEELVPGFKFSRASYVLSLLRPFIIKDLKLEEFGLKLHMREPYSSFTPIRESQWSNYPSKYLLLSSDMDLSCKEISKFSSKDAQNYPKYEKQLSQFIQAVNILLDNRPPNFWQQGEKHFFASEKLQSIKSILQVLASLRGSLPDFHEMLTASADKILNKWFESEPLKATLATDALIGNMAGPSSPGTGYVLLHHLMGGVNGKAGAWAYPEGGMGAVSDALAASVSKLGASIFTNKEVSSIVYDEESKSRTARGVILKSGEEIRARLAVFSSTTPEVTFKKFFPQPKQVRNEIFGSDFVQSVDQIDYTSPVTKINVAVTKLPVFSAKPNPSSPAGQIHDEHKCTIHLNSETMSDLLDSYSSAALQNIPSQSPMIEMVIPSSLDETLAPKGAHVCLLFTQFTPIQPSNGTWTDPDFKEKYAQRAFDIIEGYSPGFKKSVVGSDILTPKDLEDTFGLTGGNIFHGAMSLDQLYWLRPFFTKSCWFPKTPLKGLYLCGSGCHPGGGVMGVPGYLAATTFLNSK